MSLRGAIALCFILWYFGTQSAEDVKVKVIPAAFINEVPRVIISEKTVRLLFRVPLPPIDIPQPKIASSRIEKEASNIVIMLAEDLKEEMSPNLTAPFGPIRRKRQIEVVAGALGGFALSSALDRVLDKLFGSNSEIEAYVKKLHYSVAENQRHLVLIDSELEGFATNISYAFQRASSEVNKEVSEVLHGLLAKIGRDWLVESKYACLLRTIPSKMVSPSTLKERLTTLESNLLKHGKTLAIPLSDFATYFKIPLVDCAITDSHMIVHINVPVRRAKNQWKLFEIFHSKFAFENQTCELYPQEGTYLATSETKTVMISGNMKDFCDVKNHGLCLVPEFTRDSTESLDCVIGILKGRSVEKLQKSCAFCCCSDNSELIVRQISDDYLLMTNVVSIEMTCQNGKRFFQFEKLGAISVLLQCNCSMLINGYFLIDAPFYCNNYLFTSDPMYRVSPNLWSQFKKALGFHSQYFDDHSNETIDKEWAYYVPVLNVTRFRHREIPAPPEPGFSFVHAWLILLTVCVFFLIGFSCLIFVAFIKH